MATVHREPNQVKWIGVRPGHNGDQIHEYGTAVGATTVVYTVPADKILLLFGFNLITSCTVAGTASLGIYTAVPALHRYLSAGTVRANFSMTISQDYVVPIEIAAAYSIRAISPAGTLDITACINGILIDA